MGLGQKGPSSRQTFSKADRLLQRYDFLRLTKNGQRCNNRYFIAYVCKNDYNRCRLGITVTRKVGKASLRNRLKRHAREYFRQNRHNLQGYLDISIIAKREATELVYNNATLALESIFAQIAKTLRS